MDSIYINCNTFNCNLPKDTSSERTFQSCYYFLHYLKLHYQLLSKYVMTTRNVIITWNKRMIQQYHLLFCFKIVNSNTFSCVCCVRRKFALFRCKFYVAKQFRTVSPVATRQNTNCLLLDSIWTPFCCYRCDISCINLVIEKVFVFDNYEFLVVRWPRLFFDICWDWWASSRNGCPL